MSQVSFQMSNNRWLRWHDDGAVTCDGSAPGLRDTTFVKYSFPDGRKGFRNLPGRWLSAVGGGGGPCTWSATSVGETERFVEGAFPTGFSYTVDRVHFLTAAGVDKPGTPLLAVAFQPQAAELFRQTLISVFPPDDEVPFNISVNIDSSKPAKTGSGPIPERPVPQVRSSLHFFDKAGPHQCHFDLPPNMTIPAGPDRKFMRANAWAVTVPGLPFVPGRNNPLLLGGSSRHPERCLSWFLDRWSAEWQDKILHEHAVRGYTDFILSWPDSRANGLSAAGFVEMALKVKSLGFFVTVFLTSKVYDPLDMDTPTYASRVDDVLAALIAAHAMDKAVVGWELDLFNEPHRLQSNIEHVAGICRPAGVDVYVHFGSLKTSWQFPGEPRAAFWSRNHDNLTGLLYQADPNMGYGDLQAHLNDAQVPAAGLNGFTLVWFEYKGERQFDDDDCTEDVGDMYGWAGLSTPGPIAVSGFGGGCRRQDGSVI